MTASHVAARVGLSPQAVHAVELVATELAENLHRHAIGGELLVLPPDVHGATDQLRLVAVDRGPGVADFDRCLADGFSTDRHPRRRPRHGAAQVRRLRRGQRARRRDRRPGRLPGPGHRRAGRAPPPVRRRRRGLPARTGHRERRRLRRRALRVADSWSSSPTGSATDRAPPTPAAPPSASSSPWGRPRRRQLVDRDQPADGRQPRRGDHRRQPRPRRRPRRRHAAELRAGQRQPARGRARTGTPSA